MKKNSKITLFTVFVILITLITLIATSGTFAKYTSSIDTTNSSAVVAKWLVKINDQNMNDAQDITFNLFDTIKSTGGMENEEAVVKAAEGQTPIIAPGTSGSFSFRIKNESQVKASYSIDFTETNDAGIPILYRVGNTGNWVTADNLASAITGNELDYNTEKTVTLNWKWAYGHDFETNPVEEGGEGIVSDDDVDNNLGTQYLQSGKSQPTYTVKATITATQVD